ncbi:hypothetical protein G3I39_24985 [Streptomyces fulvissimus]|uniref:Uncharacterized protein n=1 Tax=Streptomyces microflavus TaxID=1919 RepID=A0A6N9VBM6_STRMI|nr:hypothetical protein [Streptomyces microflavus]NEB70284.1 hypothetical protein [Streptomyces microflavus]NEE56333.1 hypothetical protein [Streptomyces sp. SID8455]
MNKNSLAVAIVPLLAVAFAVWQVITLASYDVRATVISAVVLSTLANGLFMTAAARRATTTH